MVGGKDPFLSVDIIVIASNTALQWFSPRYPSPRGRGRGRGRGRSHSCDHGDVGAQPSLAVTYCCRLSSLVDFAIVGWLLVVCCFFTFAVLGLLLVALS